MPNDEDDENENGNGNGKNGRKLTKHHILPRSRGGNGEKGENNIVKVPQRFHEAWHIIFGNMTVKETIKFIEIIFGRKRIKKTWTPENLYVLQLDLQKETTIRRKKELGEKRERKNKKEKHTRARQKPRSFFLNLKLFLQYARLKRKLRGILYLSYFFWISFLAEGRNARLSKANVFSKKEAYRE